MAHMPMDDAVLLYNDNKQKTWSGLEQVLQQRKGKAEGISDTLINMLMPMVHDMAQSRLPYPNSAKELNEELNSRLEKIPASAR